MYRGNTPPPYGGEVSPPGKLLPPCRGSIDPIRTKIIYDLTIAITNKYFEFQNDWLKIIRIRYNGTQFCPITTVLKKSKISNNIGTS